MKSFRFQAASVTLTFAAIVACAVPAPAAAAGEPQITVAGIDSTDRFAIAWQLAPNTKFDDVYIATTSIPDPLLPEVFAGETFVDFECARPAKDCRLPATATSWRSTRRGSRDRRYYVKVNAIDAKGESRTSPIWVIDDAKPIIPGRPKASQTATNMPALGHLFSPPPAVSIPTTTLALLSPPKTIDGVLRSGIRARLSCPVAECFGQFELKLGSRQLTLVEASIRPDGSRSVVLRPRGNRRRELRKRSAARLYVRTLVLQPGGKRTRLTRSLSVKR
jgi:hypothetical protein